MRLRAYVRGIDELGLRIQNQGLATLAMPLFGAKQPDRVRSIDGHSKSMVLCGDGELASLPIATMAPNGVGRSNPMG